MRKKWLMTWALLTAGAIAGSAAGDEFDALVQQCDGCHGLDGVSQWSDVPTIAGISEFVHSDALFIYQDKARPCKEDKFRAGDTTRAPTDMCAVTADLSEAQIEALAAYYAAKPFAAATQKFDPALAKRGHAVHEQACERCHSDGGANAEDDAGILKGQWMEYMRRTFAEYKASEREQPKKMKAKFDPLSEEDLETLLHFYASPD
ncbi:MAG: c-type cytochrome [Pseudomonadales bacterium]